MSPWLDVLGYVGMAFVLLSMAMTKLVWLRWLNLCGSVLSLVYGALTATWPTAYLNFGLCIINIVQLIRLYRQKKNASV